MYLSRLVLNRRSRQVRQDLADCNGLHKTILRAFPEVAGANGSARARLGVLHRVDEDPRTGELLLYVQSSAEPCWDHLPESWASRVDTREVGEVFAALGPGTVLAFRLRANPTKRLGRTAEGKLGPGKRVALVREADHLAWLARKAKSHGFDLVEIAVDRPPPDFLDGLRGAPTGAASGPVLDVRTMPEPVARGRKAHADGQSTAQLTLGAVVFEGRLRVVDSALFREALARGIGSGKAYGFGLLSIARAP